MPYIRHHAVITSEDGDVEHSVTAYEETPFGEDEWHPDRENEYARLAHEHWVKKNVKTNWELLYG